MISQRLNKIWYGGDYNPEQWPEEIWDEDMRLFKRANLNVATIGVFSWALIQVDEVTYDFTILDRIMDTLAQNNIRACLATGTAAHPAWLAKKYPDVLRVDFYGRKRKFGRRHNSCPNSPTYRKFSGLLARKLAERYKEHPALVAWHVNNEYGGRCYCENCERAFRVWLKKRYQTLDNLNRAWNTTFWSHTFYDWDEIVVPNVLSEHMDEHDQTKTAFQGISLDYDRFFSDSLLEAYKVEYEEIKKVTPDVMVTTNLMGTYKPVDYFKLAKHLDIVSWDSYPSNDTPISTVAMRHDLMRGLKDGSPFMLMEQTPSQQNWQPYNALKRPGVMRLWSYQAVAHGADTVMFFQLRRSIGACEKFHGAVIEHAGHENTRVFREVSQLGEELARLGDKIIDSRIYAEAAIVFDWENWWALEYSSGPSVDLKYLREVEKYYQAFYENDIQVDMVGLEADLSQYEIVVAPLLYMVKNDYHAKLEEFVQNGGTFVTTFLSGIVDESDLVTPGGYPGKLRPLLGIWAEEIDALPPGARNSIVLNDKLNLSRGSYDCELLCDLIHSEGAEILATYGDDFYQGMPVLTRNQYGKGEAWYVASSPELAFLIDFVSSLCQAKGVKPVLPVPSGVEVSQRIKGNRAYTFVLNHSDEVKSINLGSKSQKELLSGKTLANQVSLAPKDVLVLES